MCLIAFAWRADADFPLVVAGNRDEFFARPTTSAAWSADDRVLAGRDLRSGGTWMGVTRDGRFAALTNHRDPAAFRSDAPSRGELVDRVLRARHPGGTLDDIAHDGARFNGFNLIVAQWGDADAMTVVSHPGASTTGSIGAGIHGLSNARLDTPWPKVTALQQRLRSALASTRARDDLIARLFDALADPRIAADAELPHTGVPHAFERALSAAFIRTPGYGTRSSTVLVVERDGRATFVERRCEPDVPVDQRRFDFRTPPLSAAPAS